MPKVKHCEKDERRTSNVQHRTSNEKKESEKSSSQTNRY
jgi:hypothetical protein